MVIRKVDVGEVVGFVEEKLLGSRIPFRIALKKEQELRQWTREVQSWISEICSASKYNKRIWE